MPQDQRQKSRLALFVMGLALALLFLSLPEGKKNSEVAPETGGHSTQSSIGSSGPADLTEAQIQLAKERHKLTLDFERMTSQNPRVWPGRGRPIDYGVELEGERFTLEEIDPSVPMDPQSPKQQILRHLKAMQDHEQWRVNRNEAFVREVLRRAREDGWIVKLDENLKVVEVRRARPEPYRDSSGSAAQ